MNIEFLHEHVIFWEWILIITDFLKNATWQFLPQILKTTIFNSKQNTIVIPEIAFDNSQSYKKIYFNQIKIEQVLVVYINDGFHCLNQYPSDHNHRPTNEHMSRSDNSSSWF